MGNFIRIFIIRHGLSESNENNKIKLKKADRDIELTFVGILESLSAGSFLKKNYYINNMNSVIFSSPYKRAFETATNINKSLNIQIKKNDKIVNRNSGLFSGLSKKERFIKYPNEAEWFYKNKEWKNDFFIKEPMGESPSEVAIRFNVFWNDVENYYIKKNNYLENIFLVSHSTTNMVMTKELLGESSEWFSNQKEPDNASIRLLLLNKTNNSIKDFKNIFSPKFSF